MDVWQDRQPAVQTHRGGGFFVVTVSLPGLVPAGCQLPGELLHQEAAAPLSVSDKSQQRTPEMSVEVNSHSQPADRLPSAEEHCEVSYGAGGRGQQQGWDPHRDGQDCGYRQLRQGVTEHIYSRLRGFSLWQS